MAHLFCNPLVSICYSEMSVHICFVIPWWYWYEHMLQWNVCAHLFCNPLVSTCYSEMSVCICFAIPWWANATGRCLCAFVLQSPGEQMLQWDVCARLFCNPLVSTCYSEMSVCICFAIPWWANATVRCLFAFVLQSPGEQMLQWDVCTSVQWTLNPYMWSFGMEMRYSTARSSKPHSKGNMNVQKFQPAKCSVCTASMSNSCFLGSRCKEGNGGYSTYTIWLPRYTKPFCVHSTHVKLLLPEQ